MKLCKDCRWIGWPGLISAYSAGNHESLATCTHPNAPKSPISGSAYLLCWEARKPLERFHYPPQPEYCGPEAKWFEAKEGTPFADLEKSLTVRSVEEEEFKWEGGDKC